MATFRYSAARDTFLDWPKGHKLDPGTYFWRVAGISGSRNVADSGRAAFVVTELRSDDFRQPISVRYD